MINRSLATGHVPRGAAVGPAGLAGKLVARFALYNGTAAVVNDAARSAQFMSSLTQWHPGVIRDRPSRPELHFIPSRLRAQATRFNGAIFVTVCLSERSASHKS